MIRVIIRPAPAPIPRLSSQIVVENAAAYGTKSSLVARIPRPEIAHSVSAFSRNDHVQDDTEEETLVNTCQNRPESPVIRDDGYDIV
jgi:hypothetical protein